MHYLRECIDSIISQSYKDWEIIAVVDGGTDLSADIIQEYAHKDKRVKVTIKTNEGVSVARNIGLRQASGDYILFCDADDMMMPSALQIIADGLNQNPVDYLRYEFKTIDEGGHNLHPNYEIMRRRKSVGKVVDAAICIKDIVRNEFFLWSGAFKKCIIESYAISFLPGCTYNEDTLFIMQFMQHSNTHLYIPNVLYGYRKYSVAVTSCFTRKNYDDVKEVFAHLYELYFATGENMQNAIMCVLENIGSSIYHAASSFGDEEYKVEIRKICADNPQTLEWKLIAFVGPRLANCIVPVALRISKITRKIKYICGR